MPEGAEHVCFEQGTEMVMPGWEYMTYDLTKRKNEIESLNRLGREGWEAVAMVSSWGVGWRFVHPIVLLKRLLADDAR